MSDTSQKPTFREWVNDFLDQNPKVANSTDWDGVFDQPPERLPLHAGQTWHRYRPGGVYNIRLAIRLPVQPMGDYMREQGLTPIIDNIIVEGTSVRSEEAP